MHKRWEARLCRASMLSSVCALLAACSGRAEPEDAPGQATGELEAAAPLAAALSSGASCDALLARLQTDLLEQVDARAAELRRGNSNYYGPGVFVDDEQAVSEPAPASPGGAPSGSPGLGSDSPDSGGFSGTTVQVDGVDEGDFVKTAGDRIYLLHGPTLYVLNAWPAAATEVLGSAAIEGEASELLVHDGKVVVFSRVYGDIERPNGQYPGYYYYYYPVYTKLTVLDVEGETPEVVRESYVEGDLGSTRRHDSVVRALVRHGAKAQLDYPSIAYVNLFGDPYSQAQVDLQVDLWVELTTDAILGSALDDYLPNRFERVDGALVAQPPRCADYWLPGLGLTQAGSSSILSLDLDAAAAPLRSVTVLGYADRLYANDDAALVTQVDYRYYNGQVPNEQTYIHRFELDGVDTRYDASGSVGGYIQSQFSLDDADGVVRVSTTESRYRLLPVEPGGVQVIDSEGPVSRIVTLSSRGQRLVELGRTPDFGESEFVYATRFIGDRGYVVTFRQTDPLFVVDLSDPRSPSIVGELQLPGFSNFLYPLPDHQLFAIGQDGDARGFTQGVALQIFDVRDPAAPRLAHKYVIEGQGYSAANSDHRALTFHPDQDLVSFPYESYETGTSSLEVFHVSASDGFTRVGGISAQSEERSLEECLLIMGYSTDESFLAELEADPTYRAAILRDCQYYYYRESIRRGLFRDDTVYTIGTASVGAYTLDALAGPPVAEVSLPNIYYGGGIIAPGFAGSGMGGGAAFADAGAPPSEGAVAGAGGGAAFE